MIEKEFNKKKKFNSLEWEIRKELRQWFNVHVFRSVELVGKETWKHLFVDKLCILTFIADELATPTQKRTTAEHLNAVEKLSSNPEFAKYTFGYVPLSAYPDLAKKNGVTANVHLPRTIYFDFNDFQYINFPTLIDVPTNQREELFVSFLRKIQSGEVKMMSSIDSWLDYIRIKLSRFRHRLMNEPDVYIFSGIGILSVIFMIILYFSRDDMEDRRRRARELQQKENQNILEEERKRKESSRLQKKNLKMIEKSKNQNEKNENDIEAVEKRGSEKDDGSVVMELTKLVEMKNKGFLSETEFAQAKQMLLQRK